MSNMAVGIPIGFAAGIGAGIASGKKQAREEISKKILDFCATHQMTITKPDGFSMSVDEFIREVIGEDEKMNKKTVAAIILGVLILLVGLGVFLLFYFKS